MPDLWLIGTYLHTLSWTHRRPLDYVLAGDLWFRELMWMAVPVTALVFSNFVSALFIIGRSAPGSGFLIDPWSTGDGPAQLE